MMKWYVYELSDADGVFYVGKGCGNRIETTKKQGAPEKIKRAENCEAKIIKRFRKEQDALDYEQQRIDRYGIDNLTNVSPGGGKARNTSGMERFIPSVYDFETMHDFARAVLDKYKEHGGKWRIWSKIYGRMSPEEDQKQMELYASLLDSENFTITQNTS